MKFMRYFICMAFSLFLLTSCDRTQKHLGKKGLDSIRENPVKIMQQEDARFHYQSIYRTDTTEQISFFKELPTDTLIKQTAANLYIKSGVYSVYIDHVKAARYCDSMIKKLSNKKDAVQKSDYVLLKKIVLHTTNILTTKTPSDILLNFRCNIVNKKTKTKANSILVEEYKIPIRGHAGKKFSAISPDGKIEIIRTQEYSINNG